MFKSSVIGYKDDVTTSIEYTFDTSSNAAHNNLLSDEHKSITDDSKDVSLTEQYDHNDKILINNLNNVIVKIQTIAGVPFSTSVNEVQQIFHKNLTPNLSILLSQFKTVSLLI